MVGVLVLAAGLFFATSPAYAASHGTALNLGDFLYSGDYISRTLPNFKNETVKLIMQSDGNLVEYVNGRACWGSNTYLNGDRAVYQTDGNFVVYHGNTATWASNTFDHTAGNTVDINWVGKIYVGYTAISGECN
jgi:hypothetical protein